MVCLLFMAIAKVVVILTLVLVSCDVKVACKLAWIFIRHVLQVGKIQGGKIATTRLRSRKEHVL